MTILAEAAVIGTVAFLMAIPLGDAGLLGALIGGAGFAAARPRDG